MSTISPCIYSAQYYKQLLNINTGSERSVSNDYYDTYRIPLTIGPPNLITHKGGDDLIDKDLYCILTHDLIII